MNQDQLIGAQLLPVTLTDWAAHRKPSHPIGLGMNLLSIIMDDKKREYSESFITKRYLGFLLLLLVNNVLDSEGDSNKPRNKKSGRKEEILGCQLVGY
jgi:hypothetical protein